MSISEQDLRAMIREAIARHSGGAAAAPAASPVAPDLLPVRAGEGPSLSLHLHSSHGLFVVAGAPDGECVIEPAHRCDHCGYCKSLGH
jgi:hypothetical protein